ncbi:MAG: hypothetical protein ACMUFK_03415 [Thermoplasmatota archaeon]
MAVVRGEPKDSTGDSEAKVMKVPWVTWIAIALGVMMTGIGVIMLLWGFMWQADVGENTSLKGDRTEGGPCLIPVGVAMITVGILWVLTGWRGFRKSNAQDDMMRCPNCGRMIESDLNFCYLCNTTFEDDPGVNGRREGMAGKNVKNGEETAKRARPLSPGRER